MKRMILKSVSLLLAAALLCTGFPIAALPFSARAAEDPLTLEGDGDHYFQNSWEPYSLHYNDNMFLKNANAESTDLAKLGVELAWAAYSSYSIRELYKKMGFSCRSYNYDRELTYEDNDYVFYSFGIKSWKIPISFWLRSRGPAITRSGSAISIWGITLRILSLMIPIWAQTETISGSARPRLR